MYVYIHTRFFLIFEKNFYLRKAQPLALQYHMYIYVFTYVCIVCLAVLYHVTLHDQIRTNPTYLRVACHAVSRDTKITVCVNRPQGEHNFQAE
jgi:hypothetical protein